MQLLALRQAALAAFLLGLASCAGQNAATRRPALTPKTQYGNGTVGTWGYDNRVPDFATRNFEPFNRQDAAAIALREWRLFGAPVADYDPHGLPELTDPALKPERIPGLWQRVGEYWWIGQDQGELESSWTGKTDGEGRRFSAAHDGHYAWSAAFISYVMRIAGANERFPYSPNHATYINSAASGQSAWLSARDPATYAPQIGDLLCVGRSNSENIRFSSLPTSYPFPAHCGIVVAIDQNGQPYGHQINVIGGNVSDAVALTHVPADTTGRIADSSGTSYDSRYPWCVVLQIRYDADFEPDSGL